MGLTPTVQEGLTEAVTQDASFAVAGPWLSLHSADPGSSGTNEITSGTGASGRQLVAFTGSSGTDTNSALVSVAVAGSTTVTWIGYWDAQTGGAFTGGFPLVGPPAGATAESGSDTIACPGHGLLVNDVVRLFDLPGVTNSAIPTGLSADTGYYVVTVVDADNIQISATMSGDPISVSSAGLFTVALDQSQTFVSAGTLSFPATSGITYSTAS